MGAVQVFPPFVFRFTCQRFVFLGAAAGGDATTPSILETKELWNFTFVFDLLFVAKRPGVLYF